MSGDPNPLAEILAGQLRARTATDGHAEQCDALDPCQDCRDAAAVVRAARVPEQTRREVPGG